MPQRQSDESQLEILSKMYGRYHLGLERGVTLALSKASYRKDCASFLTSDFHDFDQEHFGGTEPVDVFLTCLEQLHSCQVLDVGSGLGGAARHIAQAGCMRVTAVEVHPDRARLAIMLNKLVALDKRVEVLPCDFLTADLDENSYDGVLAILSILHMPEKQIALKKISNSLKPSGRFLIEDFVCPRPLTEEESSFMREEISCPNLMSLDSYLHTLNSAGLRVDSVEQRTVVWAEASRGRLKTFRDNRLRYLNDFSHAEVEDINRLFTASANMLTDRIVEGYRIIGTKTAGIS